MMNSKAENINEADMIETNEIIGKVIDIAGTLIVEPLYVKSKANQEAYKDIVHIRRKYVIKNWKKTELATIEETKMNARMEEEITKLETDYTGEYRRGL